jgi:hypothetical protein
MSSEPTPNSSMNAPLPTGKLAPSAVPPSMMEDTVAENYIATELNKARISLQRTRLFALAFLLLLGGEMVYITSHFAQTLQPHAAAEVADGLIMEQISDKGPDLVSQLKQKVPEYIAQTPDYALEQLPKYRVSLADRVEAEMNKYCQSTSQQLGRHLDSYLSAHQGQIKGMLTATEDPAVTQQVGQDLKQQLLAYLHEKPEGGESMLEKVNSALVSLQETQKRLHRLAHAQKLTPEEKKTRRAIAILAQGIEKQGNAVKETFHAL